MMTVRYEDFVDRPMHTTDKIMVFLSGGEDKIAENKHSDSYAGEYHSISGNPRRFTGGLCSLKKDESWHSMNKAAKLLAKIILFYQMRKYGYLR